MKKYEKLENLMQISLNEFSPYLSEQNIKDITEYIFYGEYGVAWELLWYLVDKQNLALSKELIFVGEEMGFIQKGELSN